MSINTTTRSNQVKDYLIRFVNQNRLKQGDQLPSEAAMAEQLGVSRNTLREAYISLENEGIIIRRHGIGTFVARAPVIRDSLNDFFTFPQIIRAAGYIPSFKTLSTGRVKADVEIYELFAAPISEKLLNVKRLVLADGTPAVYVDDYFAPSIKETDFDWDSFNGSIVEVLKTSLHLPIHTIHSSITAAALSHDIAHHLRLVEGQPIISVRSTIYTGQRQPVVYSRIFFNSDIVELDTVRVIRD